MEYLSTTTNLFLLKQVQQCWYTQPTTSKGNFPRKVLGSPLLTIYKNHYTGQGFCNIFIDLFLVSRPKRESGNREFYLVLCSSASVWSSYQWILRRKRQGRGRKKCKCAAKIFKSGRSLPIKYSISYWIQLFYIHIAHGQLIQKRRISATEKFIQYRCI